MPVPLVSPSNVCVVGIIMLSRVCVFPQAVGVISPRNTGRSTAPCIPTTIPSTWTVCGPSPRHLETTSTCPSGRCPLSTGVRYVTWSCDVFMFSQYEPILALIFFFCERFEHLKKLKIKMIKKDDKNNGKFIKIRKMS